MADGVFNLSPAIKNQINTTVKKFAKGKKFNKQQAQQVSDVLQVTSAPSPQIQQAPPKIQLAQDVRRGMLGKPDTRGFFKKTFDTLEKSIEMPSAVSTLGGPGVSGPTPDPLTEVPVGFGKGAATSLVTLGEWFLGGPMQLDTAVNALTGEDVKVTKELGDTLRKGLEPTNAAQEVGFGMEFLAELVAPAGKLGQLSKVPSTATRGQKLKGLAKESLATVPVETFTFGLKSGEIGKKEIEEGLAAGAFVFGVPLLAKGVSNLFKGAVAEPVKKAIMEVRLNKEFGADKAAKQKAKELINVNDSLLKLGKKFQDIGKKTVKMQRDLVDSVRRLAGIADDNTANQFLKETEDFRTVTKDKLNAYEQRANDLLGMSEGIFRPRTVGKQVQPTGIGVGEQRTVGFANVPKQEPPKIKTTFGGEVKVNTMTERLLEDPNIDDAIKQKIRANPNSFHEVVGDKAVQDIAKKMTDEELEQAVFQGLVGKGAVEGAEESIRITSNTKMGQVAGFELFERLQSKGNFDKAATVVDALQGVTNAAQVLQSQRLLYNVERPAFRLFRIQRMVQQRGLEVSEAGSKKLMSAFEAEKKVKNQMDEALIEYKNAIGTKGEKAAYKKLERKKLDYDNAIIESNRNIRNHLPPDAVDRVIQMIQGNVLIPASQVDNIIYNTLLVPPRLAQREISILGDVISSNLAKVGRAVGFKKLIPEEATKRKVTRGNLRAIARGFQEGLRQANNAFIKGQTGLDVTKVDISPSMKTAQRGTNPAKALMSFFEEGEFAVNPKTGSPIFMDKIDRGLEVAAGLGSEQMLRLLNYGDMPFKGAAYYDELYKQWKLKRINKEEVGDIKTFLIDPPKDVQKIATERSRQVVLQEENKAANLVLHSMATAQRVLDSSAFGKAFPLASKALNVVMRTQSLFTRTPFNSIKVSMKLAFPWLNTPEIITGIKTGNRRKALEAGALMSIAYSIKEISSLVTESGAYSSGTYEGPKKEKFKLNTVPSGHINLSRLGRYMQYKMGLRDDPGKFYEGGEDVIVSTKQWNGLNLRLEYDYLMKDIAFKEEKKKAEGKIVSDSEISRGMRAIAIGATTSLSNSVLDSVGRGLEALLQTPESSTMWNSWLARQVDTLASIVPASGTLKALTRSQEDYLPQIDRHGGLYDRIVSTRFFGTTDLPAKIGFFGEKITRTPESENPLLQNVFDATKAHQLTKNRRYLFLGELFNQLPDEGLLPPNVEAFVKDKKVELTGEDYMEYQQSIGLARGIFLDRYMDLGIGDVVKPENQMIMLKKLWTEGRALGKAGYFGDDLPATNYINKLEITAGNYNLTRASYGSELDSRGIDTNEGGIASASDWREYQKNTLLMTNGNLEKVEEMIDTVVKEFDTKNYNDEERVIEANKAGNDLFQAGWKKGEVNYFMSSIIPAKKVKIGGTSIYSFDYLDYKLFDL